MSRATESSSTAQPEPRMGFLEKLYLDRFDKALFQGLSFPPPDPRTIDIIQRYRELIKAYPPAKLEKEGSIPDELMDGLKELGPHRVLLMPDHATPIEIKTHSGEAVPFAIYDSEVSNGSGRTYDEACAAKAGIHIENGYELMGKFIRKEL